MAVHFKTSQPENLLKEFKEKISAGKIVTWSCDEDGDFTHNVEQWRNRAWFRHEVKTDELVFNILGQKENIMSSLTYAIFHGRLIESMLTHCDKLFSEASASSLPEAKDRLGGSQV